MNLSEGFRGLGEGLADMAKSAGAADDQNAMAMRQENLARLQAKLGEESQGRLFAQQDKAQAARDKAAGDRQDAAIKAQGDRTDAQIAAQNARVDRLTAAQNEREDARLATQGELAARKEALDRRNSALRQKQQATTALMQASRDLAAWQSRNPGVTDIDAARQTDTFLNDVYQRQQKAQEDIRDADFALTTSQLNGMPSIPQGAAQPTTGQDLIQMPGAGANPFQGDTGLIKTGQ